jgi:release factor glutamine methyltransferase
VLLAKYMREVLQTRAVENQQHKPLRLLEMGIGEGALVSLSLARSKVNLTIDGVDCSAARVNSSQQVADYNSIKVHFWQSDLFAQVPRDSSYDYIFFNPPYVPTHTGRTLRLTQRLEVDGDQMWDGGDDGACVLRAFLSQSQNYLATDGRVVFGVQEVFLPDKTVQKVVAEASLEVIEKIKRGWLPSTAYSIGCSGGLPCSLRMMADIRS